jgi:hypothetical protein
MNSCLNFEIIIIIISIFAYPTYQKLSNRTKSVARVAMVEDHNMTNKTNNLPP